MAEKLEKKAMLAEYPDYGDASVWEPLALREVSVQCVILFSTAAYIELNYRMNRSALQFWLDHKYIF